MIDAWQQVVAGVLRLFVYIYDLGAKATRPSLVRALVSLAVSAIIVGGPRGAPVAWTARDLYVGGQAAKDGELSFLLLPIVALAAPSHKNAGPRSFAHSLWWAPAYFLSPDLS